MTAAVATVAFVIALLVAEWRDSMAGRWMTKPIASLGFIVAGVMHGASSIVVVALVLSAIGDVLLIPRSKSAFLAGVAAFLFAHVAYAVAFWKFGVDPMTAGFAALPIAVVAVPIARMIMPKVERSMKVPIGIYIVVVSSMFVLAIGTRTAALAVAAAMFWLSDLSVARDKFIRPSFSNRLWGLPLYYGAQLVFALGSP